MGMGMRSLLLCLMSIPAENIRRDVLATWQVSYLIRKLPKFGEPACLAWTHMWLRLNVLQWFMVSVYRYRGAKQVTAPLHAVAVDGKELSVNGRVIQLRPMELRAPVAHKAEDTLVRLGQGGPYSNTACICGHYKVT